jgi:hypothetical protein
MTERRAAPPGPHLPTPWEPRHVSAFQALQRGDASDHQQRIALEWLHVACGTYDLSYRPGDPVATAFAEGKRSIGLQLRKMLALNARAFTKEEG